MTRDEKRIAIAKACGWRAEKSQNPDFETVWIKGASYTYGLPDYFGSLDAMHEAENVLKTANNHALFRKHLEQICADDAAAGLHWSGIYVHATAQQRAEAFGLALNLWKEGE